MNPTDDSHQMSQLPHPRTSPQLEGDDQGGGEEWGCEEKRLFDSAQAELDPNCPDLFQKIQWRVPGKTIEEIKRHYDLVNNLVEENLPHPPQQPPRNRRVLSREKPPISDPNPHFPQWGPWTWREHELFLMGLIRYGTGDWKRISRDFVYTRTPKQVGHHAQAYLKRPYRLGDRIRRRELAASKFRTSQPVDAVKSAPSSSEPVSTVPPEILMGGKCSGGSSEGKAIVHQPPPLTTLELFPVTHSTAAPIPSQPSVGCFTIGLPVGAGPSTYARRYGAHPALGLPIGVPAGPSTSVARASAGFSAGELSLGLPIGASSNTIGIPAGASTSTGFSMGEDLSLGLPICSSSDSDFTIAVPAAGPPPSIARALSPGFRGGKLSFGFPIASSTIDGDFTIGLPVGSSTQSLSHAASSPVGELSLGLPVGSSVNGDITLGLPASGTSMGARTSAAVSGGELTNGNSAGQDSMIGGPVLSSSTAGMAAGFHMGTPIVSSSDSQTSNTLSTEGMAVGWPVGTYLNVETSGAFLLDSLTLNTINAQTAVTTHPPYGFTVGLPVGSSMNTHNSRAFSPTDFTVGFFPNTQAIRVASPSGFTIGWPASIPPPHPISNFTIGTPIGYRVNPQTRAFSLDHFVIGIPVTTVNFQSFGASPSDFSSGFPIADSMSTSTAQSYRASSPCTDDSTIGLPVEENFYFTMGLPVSPPINQQTLGAPSPNILTTGVPISTSPDNHTSSSTASSLSDFAIGLAIGTPIHAQNAGDSSSSLSDLDELSSLRRRRRGRG